MRGLPTRRMYLVVAGCKLFGMKVAVCRGEPCGALMTLPSNTSCRRERTLPWGGKRGHCEAPEGRCSGEDQTDLCICLRAESSNLGFAAEARATPEYEDLDLATLGQTETRHLSDHPCI